MIIWNKIYDVLLKFFKPRVSTTPLDAVLSSLKAKLDKLTAYPIQNILLFSIALTHRSAVDFIDKDVFQSNERLEFLGDAVLDLVVAEHLFTHYPDFDEGKLTKLRSQIVNAKTLAGHARSLGIGGLMIVSDSAEAMGVRESDTTLSDALEALIGAVYLDGGYDRVKTFIQTHLLVKTNFEELLNTEQNYKSVLLEYAQANRVALPVYSIVSEDGPSHKKTFTVSVRLGDDVLGQGVGKSKKVAEQSAAREAVEKLRLLQKAQTTASM